MPVSELPPKTTSRLKPAAMGRLWARLKVWGFLLASVLLSGSSVGIARGQGLKDSGQSTDALEALDAAGWALAEPAEPNRSAVGVPDASSWVLPPTNPSATIPPEAQPQVALQRKPPAQHSGVIKTILGIFALLTLAYLGGHAKVRAWEERLGISQMMAAGFPFVVLGMLAHLPSVGVLTDETLVELDPLLHVGLGCIGFVFGFRFDLRTFRQFPAGSERLVFFSTLFPFVLALALSAAVLALVSPKQDAFALSGPLFLRDALILGAAAAMSATTAKRWYRLGKTTRLSLLVVRVEELLGVFGLALVAAYFRPHNVHATWQLPGTAWLLLSVGLGATIAALTFAILQTATRGPEFLVLSLGSIGFAAGASGYLHLSSVVVTFIAGALLNNFPGEYHTRLRDTLRRLERPILLLSLVIIGALWQLSDWRGWLLMPVFVCARLAGKWWATHPLLHSSEQKPLTKEERYELGLSPMGTLAIAIVINAKVLYPGQSISLIVSAVLGGGLLTEVFVQRAHRKHAASLRAERNLTPPSVTFGGMP